MSAPALKVDDLVDERSDTAQLVVREERDVSKRHNARFRHLERSHTLRTCGGHRQLTHDHGPSRRWLTILSAIALCSNAIVGAGTLAVPFTISLTGIGLYHLIIVFVFAASFLSLKWLLDVADQIPDDVHRNYECVAHFYLGSKADAAISSAIAFGGFALTMAYMLFITTTIVSVLAGPPFNLLSESQLQPIVLFGAGFGAVLPLSLLRDISKLKLTSTLAVGILACTAIYVVVSGYSYIEKNGIHSGIVGVKVTPSIFEAFAMSISAYSCHMLVWPIYDSLGEDRTAGEMLTVMISSVLVSAFVYELVGVAGYLNFGDETQSNILNNLAETNGDSSIRIIVCCGFAFTLICHVPMVVWPLRSCLISAYHGLRHGFEPEGEEPTACEWNCATILVIGSVLCFAQIMPNVKTALSVVGSVGGAFIVFLYPAMFHLAAVKDLSRKEWISWKNLPELVMISIGAVAGIVCLTISIINSQS